ncbi:ATP-binding protein [Streptomyces sp. NPDC092307]|uniref:ATP-binding protein n=1 Tax=Streptomyces sp. NPDC092307 TaxID=3366013 RepID=UPI0037FF3D91
MEPGSLELPSEVASVEAAAAWAEVVCAACGLEEDGHYRLGLAVREAVANAVLHGNRREPAKHVRLSWQLREGRLVVTVADEGNGFSRPEPTDEVNLTPSGRGLSLIGHFTDDYDIVRRDDPPGTDVVLAYNMTRKGRRDMKITARHTNGVTVLDLNGKLTIGVGDIALRNAIREALDSGAKGILLNFQHVPVVDSAGIGELVSGYTSVSNRGAKLKLVNLPPKLQDILQLTQLIAVFEVFDAEDEAVASF